MNFRFCIPIFFAAPLFAGEMCATLCTTCSANPMDSVCSGIDCLCYCSTVLDSIRQVEIREARAREFAVAKLSKGMDLLCRRKFCSLDLQFCGDSLVKIQTAKTPLRIKSKAHNDSTKIEEPEEPLLTQTKECRNFCRLCPEEKRNDSNCVQIENICGCRAFAEQTERLAQKAKADSLQKLEGWIARKQNLRAAADSVLKFQKESGDSLFMVTFATKDFQILDIRKTEISSPKPPQDTVTSRAIVALQDSAPDSSGILKESTVSHFDTVGTNGVPQTEMRIFYQGISIEFQTDFDNYEIINPSIGYLARWYFYSNGSFQTGLNSAYTYANLEEERDYYDYYYGNLYSFDVDFEYTYHKISVEIPLLLRLGIPLGSVFDVFVSLDVHVVKPIYSWIDAYGEHFGNHEGTYVWSEESTSSNRAFGWNHWEFMFYFGFGINISRHVSLQGQCLIESAETSNSLGPIDNEGIWRFSMDFAF